MTLLSIDPGLRELGLAYWVRGELQWWTSLRATHTGRGMHAWQSVAKAVQTRLEGVVVGSVVYESFRVYQNKVGFQADVLELAASAGALATLPNFPTSAESFHAYEPRTWTRGVPEIPRNARIHARLTPAELALFSGVDFARPGRSQHGIDAVGLGLYHLQRL